MLLLLGELHFNGLCPNLTPSPLLPSLSPLRGSDLSIDALGRGAGPVHGDIVGREFSQVPRSYASFLALVPFSFCAVSLSQVNCRPLSVHIFTNKTAKNDFWVLS